LLIKIGERRHFHGPFVYLPGSIRGAEGISSRCRSLRRLVWPRAIPNRCVI